jgi:peptide/nickel transport system permease protein
MIRYSAKVLARGLLTLLAVSILIFWLVRLTGDPLNALTEDALSLEDQAALRAFWGLDRPLHIQYLTFMQNALRFDFGQSFMFPSLGATGVILFRLPRTLLLGSVALILVLLIGVPMGVLAAVKRGSWFDRGAKALAMVGQSVPEFWLGIILIWVFAVQLDWVPTSGRADWRSVILPSVTLAVFGIAALLRLLRSSMLDTLGAHFIMTARLKGLSEAKVVWKHAFKPALIAPLTYFGWTAAHFLTGATVIEVVFAWPGLGMLAWESAHGRDFQVVQALTLIGSATLILLNLAVDLMYAVIDPRVRLGQEAVG